MSKNSLCNHICGRQHNLLPTTFFRLIWHASTILRLPRCLYNMKYYFINRLIHLINSSHADNLHYLRIIHIQTSSTNSRTHYYKFRVFKMQHHPSQKMTTLSQPHTNNCFLNELPRSLYYCTNTNN
eukprot:bmy_17795T0